MSTRARPLGPATPAVAIQTGTVQTSTVQTGTVQTGSGCSWLHRLTTVLLETAPVGTYAATAEEVLGQRTTCGR